MLTLLAQPALSSASDIFDFDGNYAGNPELFHSIAYLVCYVIFWSLLFELSLVIVLHFKQDQHYVSYHAGLNLFIILGQSIASMLLLQRHKWDWSNGFVRRELITAAFIFLQVSLGRYMNHLLTSPVLVRGIFITRYSHRCLGMLIYLMTKTQLAIYVIYHFNKSNAGYLFIGLLYFLVLITHIVVSVILRAYDASASDAHVNFLIRTSPLKKEYAEIVHNIENGEVDDAVDNVTINDAFATDDVASLNTALTVRRPIDWLLIEDRVYDITGLRHPKGNYILRATKFKDITREIHGLKAWRFENRQLHYGKTSQHKHVSRTFRFLNDHCINEIALSSVLMFRNEKRVSASETNSNLDFQTENSSEYHTRRKNRISKWKLGPVFSFANNNAGRVLFFEKQAEDVVVNLSSYWNMNYGRYFLLKMENGKCMYNFVTLSIHPRYLQLKEKWYKQLNLPWFANLTTHQSRECQELTEMADTLLASKSKAAVEQLNQDSDIRDYYLPLFAWKETSVKPEEMKSLSINGPLGFGIGFNHKSTQCVLVLARDEGILPFTDLFEFLGQRSLMEMTQMQIPHPVFGKEYLLDFANGMTINLYWEITQEFRDFAPLFGLGSLEVIEGVAKEAGDRPEETRPRMLSVFRGATVVSNLKKETGKFLNFQFESGHDYLSMKQTALRGQALNVERVVVSGSRSFVDLALKNSDLSFGNIVIL